MWTYAFFHRFYRPLPPFFVSRKDPCFTRCARSGSRATTCSLPPALVIAGFTIVIEERPGNYFGIIPSAYSPRDGSPNLDILHPLHERVCACVLYHWQVNNVDVQLDLLSEESVVT